MVRHRKTVCSACRRRKTKCDGASPRCSACTTSRTECLYETAPSLAYVRALETRIKHLEDRQGEEKPSSPLTSPVFSPHDGDSGISLDARGDVSYHNSTSAIHEAVSDDGSTFVQAQTPAPIDLWVNEIRNGLVANAAVQKGRESSNLDAALSLVSLPKHLASCLLQLHWCWLHPSFLFVYRPAFTRDMPLLDQSQRSTAYCSSTLFKVLLAHTCRFIRAPDTIWDPETYGETFQQLTDRLLSEARTSLAMETLNPPSIPTIQALLQQSAREIGAGRSSSAWLYSGMAFRMAIDLGLHVSPDKLRQYITSLSLEDIEIRKRLFWGLYAWDKHISLYLGRMPNFLTGAEDVSLEFLDEFTEQDPWTPFYGPDPEAADLPTYPPTPGHVMSCFRELCKLCKILTRVMLELYSPCRAGNTSTRSDSRKAAFMDIAKDLRAWWSDLPPFLCVQPDNIPPLSPPPHITSLNLMYHNTLILLHRPNVLRKDSSSDPTMLQSWRTCRSATSAMHDLLRVYVNTFGVHHITYMNSYCTYTAATTAVCQLETSDGLNSSEYHQRAWAELKFFSNILQSTAAAMPGLNRSIDIIRARIKKILDRQATEQLNSLFSARDGLEDHSGHHGRCEALQATSGDRILPNATVANQTDQLSGQVGPNDLPDLGSIDVWWLPAFPGQDISYGSDILQGMQEGLNPEARSALMGSDLDSHMRLDSSLLENANFGYSDHSQSLFDRYTTSPGP